MKNKRYFGILSLLFFITINLQAQDSDQITIDLSNPDKKGFLYVSTKRGTISVKGTARKDVLIKYSSLESRKKNKNKHKNKNKNKYKDWEDHFENSNSDESNNNNNNNDESKNDGLKKVASASMDLVITEDENRIKIKSSDWSKGLTLEIEIPMEMDLKLKSYNEGDIEVDNVSGTLELTSYNGPISATNISGSLIADTYNGKILASFNKVSPNEPMAFSNYNGGLDLTFPKNYAATFKINNKQGDVYTGFDMVMEKQKIEKEGNKKIVIGKWVIGKVNGGGPEVKLENYNGNIYIRTLD